jgi:chromosome segregation ATPase
MTSKSSFSISILLDIAYDLKRKPTSWYIGREIRDILGDGIVKIFELYKEANEEKEIIKRQSEQLRQQIETERREKERMKDQCEQFRKQLEDERKEKERMRKQLEQYEKLRQQLEDGRREKEWMKEQYEKLRQQLEDGRREKESMMKQLEQYEQLRQQIETERREKERIKDQCEQFRKQLEDEQREKEYLSLEYSASKLELYINKEKIEKMEDELSRINKINERYKKLFDIQRRRHVILGNLLMKNKTG